MSSHLSPSVVSVTNFRKDLILELLTDAGEVGLAYNVYRAWVSEFTALPALDAQADTVAIESLVLQHEGWERDLAVVAPTGTLDPVSIPSGRSPRA